MKIIISLIFLLASSPALAQQIPYAQNFGNVCPGGSAFCQNPAPRKVIVFDFTTGALPATVSFTRSSTAWYFDSSGNLVSSSIDSPRFDYGSPGSVNLAGLLVEGAATNLILWNRDLTQASWTPTNATISLNQTGIDGLSNSASSITSLAPNSTTCQAITHSAQPGTFSIYSKRLSGNGLIQISEDGGVTYATITLTNSWARFTHAEQSILNPTVCIKVVNNGDEIAVDATQFEVDTVHSFATSPILTSGATVTRAVDNLSISSIPWYNTAAGTYIFEWEQQSFGLAVVTYEAFNNSGYGVGVNNGNLQIPHTNCRTALIGPGITKVNKGGASYVAPGGVFSGAVNGVNCSTSGAIPLAPNALSFFRTWIRKFTYYNYSLTASQLQSATR